MRRCDINTVALRWKQFNFLVRNKSLSFAGRASEVPMLDKVKPPCSYYPPSLWENYYKLKNHVVAPTDAQLRFETVFAGWWRAQLLVISPVCGIDHGL